MVLTVLFYLVILIIFILFGISIYGLSIQQNTYNKMHKQFNEQCEKGIFENSFHIKVVKEYRKAAKRDVSLINTPALIEKSFYEEVSQFIKWERLGKQAANLLILLGLLGGFIGFLSTLNEMFILISNNQMINSLNNVEEIMSRLITVLSGAKLAFVSGLLGFFFALLYSFIRIVIKPAQTLHTHFVEIESYLDNKVALDFSKSSQEEILGQSIQDMFDSLTGQIENSYKKVLDKSVTALIQSGESQELATQDFVFAVNKLGKIVKMQEKFNISVDEGEDR